MAAAPLILNLDLESTESLKVHYDNFINELRDRCHPGTEVQCIEINLLIDGMNTPIVLGNNLYVSKIGDRVCHIEGYPTDCDFDLDFTSLRTLLQGLKNIHLQMKISKTKLL
jgi:hypothetical protein